MHDFSFHWINFRLKTTFIDWTSFEMTDEQPRLQLLVFISAICDHLFTWHRVRTLIQKTNFQDFSRTQIDFSRALKFTLTSTPPRPQCKFSLLPSIHFLFFRFLEPFRTSGLFPGLSSPGKCHNKVPGLSRFSRTRTNPDGIQCQKEVQVS